MGWDETDENKCEAIRDLREDVRRLYREIEPLSKRARPGPVPPLTLKLARAHLRATVRLVGAKAARGLPRLSLKRPPGYPDLCVTLVQANAILSAALHRREGW